MDQLISIILTVILIGLLIAQFVLTNLQEKELRVKDVEKIPKASRRVSKLKNWSIVTSTLLLIDVIAIGYFWFFAK